jgi:hypothetical protein
MLLMIRRMFDWPLITDRGTNKLEFGARSRWGKALNEAASIWRNVCLNSPTIVLLGFRENNLSIELLAEHYRHRNQAGGYCRYQSGYNTELVRTPTGENPFRQRRIGDPQTCYDRDATAIHRAQDFISAFTVAAENKNTGVCHSSPMDGTQNLGAFKLWMNQPIRFAFFLAVYINQAEMEKVAVAMSVVAEMVYDENAMRRLQVLAKVYMACEAFATVCKAILQHIHDPIKPYWWRTTGTLFEMALHLFFMQANIILPRILETRKQFEEAVIAVMKVRGVSRHRDLYQGPDGLALFIWHQYQVDHHF